MMGQNCVGGLDFGVGAATMPWLKPALQDPWSLCSRERHRNAPRDCPSVLQSLGTSCSHPAPAVTRGLARAGRKAAWLGAPAPPDLWGAAVY